MQWTTLVKIGISNAGGDDILSAYVLRVENHCFDGIPSGIEEIFGTSPGKVPSLDESQFGRDNF